MHDFSADPMGDRPMARSIANSSFLELLWGGAALMAAGLGLAGHQPRYMVALAPIALGFALLARSGALASRWPRTGRRERVGIGGDVLGAIASLGIGAFALFMQVPLIVLAAPALLLGGLLVVDGPIQDRLVGPKPGQEGAAGVAMSIVGSAAIALSLVALLVMRSIMPLLLAMSFIAVGHLVATGVTLARFTRVRWSALHARGPTT